MREDTDGENVLVRERRKTGTEVPPTGHSARVLRNDFLLSSDWKVVAVFERVRSIAAGQESLVSVSLRAGTSISLLR